MEDRLVRLEADRVAGSDVVRRRAGAGRRANVAAKVSARHVLDGAVVVRVLADVFVRVRDSAVRRNEGGEAVCRGSAQRYQEHMEIHTVRKGRLNESEGRSGRSSRGELHGANV